MEQPKAHYGLFTAISLIVGVCVGSGIFFKADSILSLTGGNVFLSVLIFLIAAACVITGSITISQLAIRTNATGGVVAYFDEFISKSFGNGFGWFYMMVYYPTILCVVAWVAGIYTLQFLGLPSNLEVEILIGTLYILAAFAMNYLSYVMAGRFQNIATIGKLIPLLGIGFVGFFWGQTPAESPVVQAAAQEATQSFAWLAALTPMAFSFEGWIVATGIAPEVKDSKRNMPLALFFGPVIVLAIYLSYFLGLVQIAGVTQILELNDAVVSVVGTTIMGPIGDKALTFFVLVAVLGVVNGLSLGFIRLPQALALRDMIPYSEKIKTISFKRGLSLNSAYVAAGLTVIWLIIHYITLKFNLLGTSDVSEIAIVFSYIGYIVLYAKVIHLAKQGEITNPLLGYVIPTLAIIGSLTIAIGGFVSNPTYLPLFMVICLAICYIGYSYGKKAQK